MKRFLLIASYPDSVVRFRGALIDQLLVEDYEVHVAAPALAESRPVSAWLRDRGVLSHDILLARTGMSPLQDLASLWSILRLMLQVRPHCVLAYTAKPVIYGMLAARIARVPGRFALITGLGYALDRKSVV
jgi:hypothetical protein